jgi:protein TonB
MTNEISAKINIDDIIFEGKNKEYGAYILRKLYKKRLTISLWASIILFTLALCTPMILSAMKPKEDVSAIRKKVITITELAAPPSIDSKQQVQEQIQAPPPLKSTIKFLPPVVKPDDQVTDEYIPTVDELKNIDPGAKTEEGQEGGVDYSLIEVEEPKEEVAPVKEEVFTYVEEMPSFAGGDQELLKFISKNIQYPEIAKRAGVEGRVLVSFVINKNGTASDFQVVRGIGAGCDEEAIRVIKLMPSWKPGRQNGQPVKVKLVVPFLFKLN